MGRPRKAATGGAPAPDAAALFAEADDTADPDQDFQHDLDAFMAAAGAKAARKSNAAAAAASKPAANAAAGGGAQPGLLPLKRIITAPTPAAPRAAAAAGSGGAAAAPGGARAPRPAAAAGGSAAAADRDGLLNADGLRLWAASRVAALQERVTSALGQQCVKVIEDGFNRVNELAGRHHAAVSAMLQSSSEALEVARGQHSTALSDIGALKDGLLGELESLKADLVGALRSEVVAPLEAGVAAAQTKYKIS